MLSTNPEDRGLIWHYLEGDAYVNSVNNDYEAIKGTYTYRVDEMPKEFYDSIQDYSGIKGKGALLKRAFNFKREFDYKINGPKFDFKSSGAKSITDSQGNECIYWGHLNSSNKPHGIGLLLRKDGFKIELGDF